MNKVVEPVATATLDEEQKQRARIRDEGLARMDEIAAKYGEDHHLFWLAMQFTTERLRQFDERHLPTSAAKRSGS